jgi:hypothetical protein
MTIRLQALPPRFALVDLRSPCACLERTAKLRCFPDNLLPYAGPHAGPHAGAYSETHAGAYCRTHAGLYPEVRINRCGVCVRLGEVDDGGSV